MSLCVDWWGGVCVVAPPSCFVICAPAVLISQDLASVLPMAITFPGRSADVNAVHTWVHLAYPYITIPHSLGACIV